MTTHDELPAEVRQFLLEKIDSVPHLEALLLIWGQTTLIWNEETLSQALYVERHTGKKIAQDLLRNGWIQRQPENNDNFVFDARWDPDHAFMQKLSSTYRKQLIRVTTLIHSNVSAAVRDFAKAFELKKD